MNNDVYTSSFTMKRYLGISIAAGALDFILAFVLLHSGFSIAASLAVSIILAGVVQYFALERWGTRRRGNFSFARLFGSGLVEFGTYCIRVVVLWSWKQYLPGVEAKEHLLGLGVAYGVAFLFGYITRSRIVFKQAVRE